MLCMRIWRRREMRGVLQRRSDVELAGGGNWDQVVTGRYRTRRGVRAWEVCCLWMDDEEDDVHSWRIGGDFVKCHTQAQSNDWPAHTNLAICTFCPLKSI